jgi:uncharacterized protein involved in exopolysaccharide biosynthesis
MKKRWLVVSALTGALASWGVYLSATPVFQAQTTVGVLPRDSSVVPEQVSQLLQTAFSRDALEHIIRKNSLYEEESRTATATDVVEHMRRDIEINPQLVNLRAVASFTVGFRHSNPQTAMRVTEQLAARVIEAGLDGERLRPTPDLDSSPKLMMRGFQIRDGARLPIEPVSPRPIPYLTVGMLAGITVGLLFSLIAFLRERRRDRMQG